jgi:HD-GYP domain-containing protein (c-di-GMP phosphodiesterase class II)
MDRIKAIKKTDFTHLDKTEVRIWKSSFAQSPIPVIILNRHLRIMWANNKFLHIFGGNTQVLGVPIEKFYFNSLNEPKIKELRKSIYSHRYGFSWTGKVEKKGIKQFSVITNLLILPILNSLDQGAKPTAYACILDNISDEYKQMLKSTFLSLLEASRLKDNDTGNHIERVNRYARCMAEKLHGNNQYPLVDREFIEDIGFLAALHDVGKIGTPDDILNKKNLLHDWEWNIMKEHTINGAYILSTYPNPMAKEIALYHHEWWDGSGYPYGLREEMIPLSARIVAIGDVYDALRMQRSYKDPLGHKETVELVKRDRDTHFDPKLIEIFLGLESEFEHIFKSLRDE